MLTTIHQMLIIEEIHIFLLFDSIQMFFKRKLFVNIAETLFTAIFSKENIRKNGQKKWKMSKLRNFFSVNSKDVMTWVCLDENMSPEVFWTPYHAHKPITRKNPLHFRRLVKKWRFFTHFFPSTKIFACLVNKCWPKFCHRKKDLIFLYTSLTLDFSYLS